jgi:two-component system chemotaxis response regulator CheY
MPRVLSVGQCGIDHATISRQLNRDFGADVVGAATFEEAVDTLRRSAFDLVLVNRVTDRDGSEGLSLIRRLKADPQLGRLPLMLVSNYPEAQEQAEAAGALPGFGKAEIGSPRTRDRIRAALAPAGDEVPAADGPAS